MYHIPLRLLSLPIFMIVFTTVIQADEGTAATINLKLDCPHCDHEYLQEEIPWVSFVRDRQDADVQLISTAQLNGSGGWEYTLTFTGLRSFAGLCDTLRFSIPPAETWENIRSGMTQQIKLGLVRYLARTPAGSDLMITHAGADKPQFRPNDKWNNWVFSARVGSYFNGEESTNYLSLWGNISAQRITAASKCEFTGWGTYDHDSYEYDGTTYISESSSQGFSAAWAGSLTDHWSAGLWGSVNSSTYSNIALGMRVGPALEYNIYPYSESVRKQLRIAYHLDGRRFLYDEETIYLKNYESLVEQSLSMRLELVRSWGSVTTDLSGSQYLHDLTKNEVSLFSDLSLQLVRGLSISLEGQVSLIHNQLSLPRDDADLEEVLLQRRQLSTQYDYWFSCGFRYTFGSIYSSVVNPRFGEW